MKAQLANRVVLAGLMSLSGLVLPASAADVRDSPRGAAGIRAAAIDDGRITDVRTDPKGLVVSYELRPTAVSLIRCILTLPDPKDWDGRLWGYGNGGWAGRAWTLFAGGAAAVHTDLGTSRTTRNDAPEPREVMEDYSWRATHLMTVSAKKLVEAYYGRRPDRCYFSGASCGGRQGLMEASRFPEDYDGIVCEVPGITEGSRTGHAWMRERLTRKYGKWFSAPEIAAVRKAELAYFAKGDPEWARGKFILDPYPTEEKLAGCWREIVAANPGLADREALWRDLFKPVVIRGRTLAQGRLLGVEFDSVWGFILPKYQGPKSAAEATEDDLAAFLDERDWQVDPDLSAFRARGGRLIMYGGLEDLSCAEPEMRAFYDAVLARLGGAKSVQEFFLYFSEPGRTHGARGEASGSGRVGKPRNLDGLIVDWVERGRRPESLSFAWVEEPKALVVTPYPDNRVSCVSTIVPRDLQAEVDAVAAQGGGVVRVPAGAWSVRPFALKSGVTVELASGATVHVAADGAGAFVTADGAERIGLRGEGVINGRGLASVTLLKAANCRGITVGGLKFEACEGCAGLDLAGCRDVIVERLRGTVSPCRIAGSVGVTLRDSELFFPGGKASAGGTPEPAWGLELSRDEQVLFERVRLHALKPDVRKPIVAEGCRGLRVCQGLRGAAPYRLVVCERKADLSGLRPDFTVGPDGIAAREDRFLVEESGEGRVKWTIFTERIGGRSVLVYDARGADAEEFSEVLSVAGRFAAAIVGCGAGKDGWLDAQRTSMDWDSRRTALRIRYDPSSVASYEFRIDASRKTPTVADGVPHIFDFSLTRPGAPRDPRTLEYVPRRVAAGEFDSVGGTVVFEPRACETPTRSLAEAGETVLWLRERHPDARIVLKPLVADDPRHAAVVNRELVKFADGPQVVAEGFPDSADGGLDLPVPSRPVARTDFVSSTRGKWSWFKRMAHKSLEIARSKGAYDLVLVGDSITHFWEGCAYWTSGRAVQADLERRFSLLNLGYGGDSTQHVLWRMENGELDGYRAKVIALMVGTNNRESPEEVAGGIRRILDVIAAKQPQATVVLQSILPRGEPGDPVRVRNEKVNAIIRGFADGRRVRWLDLTDRFLNADGTLAAGLMTDETDPGSDRQYNLHPHELGYEVWRDALLAELAATGRDAPQWPAATREAKPWAYNWWMASAVDREGLEAQCAAMEEAGLGGFHVIPIYGAKGYEAKYIRYLSPEWMRAFKDAVEIGAKHGLGVDMTMGNGWCFGGPQLKPEQGCWKLERTPDGQPPYVTWKLTGQAVKRAGPGGKGPMMDPYSTEAIDAFLAPYAVFDAPGAAKPEHVYHDSWEYFRAGWSPALFDAFRAKRGYDLREHLRELAGIGDREEVARIRCDYRETLSDLVIDDVFPRWVDWAHRRGIAVRNEAHGTCANWLDFYALADIPETEMFSDECRDILVSKFASSAAHVTGKRLVSSESCTWLGEHFTETLADFKVFIDRLLLSGVNHMFYHGCCYSPVGAVWPGWCFYASCEMNPRNPVWRDAKHLNAYITRVQSMFQACEPDNDTLVYWPVRDYWREADGFEQMMSVHNATNWFHAQPIGAVARRLSAEGCAFDYVSDRQLQKLNLGRYAKVVVPPCRHMPEATKAAIARFAERPVRTEPFSAAGLAWSRYRRGDETVYFIVNTNATRFSAALAPTAKGAKWWMDPMTGDVRPTDDRIELETYESGFLVVKGESGPRSRSLTSGEDIASPLGDSASPLLELAGPWTLTPVCGGPELPPARTMERLTTWSWNADGSENPFSGTMRYSTTFNLPSRPSASTYLLDLGRVEQSAVVRVNGREAGFAIMAPYRVRFPASLLKAGANALEVEVTSTGANRIRWNDLTGVNWKYFTDVNMLSYGYRGPLDASKWPLREYGLFGPVRLSPCGE